MERQTPTIHQHTMQRVQHLMQIAQRPALYALDFWSQKLTECFAKQAQSITQNMPIIHILSPNTIPTSNLYGAERQIVLTRQLLTLSKKSYQSPLIRLSGK